MTKTNEIGNKKHKNQWNLQILSKIAFFKKNQQKPIEIIKINKIQTFTQKYVEIYNLFKKHAKNNRKSQKILRAGGAPRPRLGLQEAVQDFSAGGFGNLHFRVLGF